MVLQKSDKGGQVCLLLGATIHTTTFSCDHTRAVGESVGDSARSFIPLGDRQQRLPFGHAGDRIFAARVFTSATTATTTTATATATANFTATAVTATTVTSATAAAPSNASPWGSIAGCRGV
jgi:hypothetical protein